MCGRYALYDFEELYDEYAIPAEFNIAPNYNAAPTQMMPVITESGIEMMRWGLIPTWAKDERMGYRLFNARSESVFEKPIWKSIITKQRCLVPANGFYEWQKTEDGKQPFYIQLKNQKLFMLAGVWGTWKRENDMLITYSILTTLPNYEMARIHNRMPLILHKDNEVQWLEADRREDIEPLLMPYEDERLSMFEVSKSVNTVKTNDDTLILPIHSK